MNDKYLRPGFEFALAHFVEECGEALAAAGKTQRWGLDGYNPELPPEHRETNRAWLERELVDVEGAIFRLRTAIAEKAGERFSSDWYQRQAIRDFEDLATAISLHVPPEDEFPNDLSFDLTLPAGHWRALAKVLAARGVKARGAE